MDNTNVLSEVLNVTGKIVTDQSPGGVKYFLAGIVSAIAAVTHYILAPIGGEAILATSSVAFAVVLFVIDFLTGITRTLIPKNDACKKCRKTCDKLSSHMAARGLIKAVVYVVVVYIALACLFLGQGTVLAIFTTIAGGGVLALLILTEVLSILENLACICVLTETKIPLVNWLLKYFKDKQEEIKDTIEAEVKKAVKKPRTRKKKSS